MMGHNYHDIGNTLQSFGNRSHEMGYTRRKFVAISHDSVARHHHLGGTRRGSRCEQRLYPVTLIGVPWKEQSTLDQRQAFVMAHLSGELSLSELCRRHQVSRRTDYKGVCGRSFREYSIVRMHSLQPIGQVGTRYCQILRIPHVSTSRFRQRKLSCS